MAQDQENASRASSSENEFSASLELRSVDWLPVGAQASLAFRRRWRGRQRALVDDVASAADMTRDDLLAAAAADEQAGDLLMRAMGRSAEVGAEDYRADLARVVSAAFDDDALIEECAYFGSLILRLEPADLRALRAAARTQSAEVMPDMEPQTFPTGIQVTASQVATNVAASVGLTASILERLRSFGLIYEDDPDTHWGQTRFLEQDRRLWSVTELGRRVLRFCESGRPG